MASVVSPLMVLGLGALVVFVAADRSRRWGIGAGGMGVKAVRGCGIIL